MIRGSKWLKCDLHVHTPVSFFQKYGDKNLDETWEKYIADLEKLPDDFKIIGINDYLTLEGYRRVLEFKRQGRLKNIICLLPVIEFRIDIFAGEGKLKRINYHVIFSNDVNVDIIQSQFLNSITAEYTLECDSEEPDWIAALTDDALIDLGQRIKKKSPDNKSLQNQGDWAVGFNNFNVSYDGLRKILKKPPFRGRVITAIGKGEWDDYRWDAGGAATKRSIINEANIVFLSCRDTESHKAAKEKLHSAQVNETLLDCSDAHYYSDSKEKDRIGNCNTWLKIEPSFNGLKQVLFVPEERIAISETHPDQKAPYQVISHVEFVNGGDHFTNIPIEFSSGLNTIIGGKSTGKSLLAGLIVKSSDPSEYERRKGAEYANDLDWIQDRQPGIGFNVHWKDGGLASLGGAENKRKITYFPQHYLNSKINDRGVGNKEVNKSIRNILSQTKLYKEVFQEHEAAVQLIDQEIALDSNNFETKLRELRSVEHLVQEKGKSEDIQKNIDKLNGELSALKSEFGLTEKELEKHRSIVESIKNYEIEAQKYKDDSTILETADEEKIKQLMLPSVLLGDDYQRLSLEVRSFIENGMKDVAYAYSKQFRAVIDSQARALSEKIAGENADISKLHAEHEPIAAKIKQSAPLNEKSRLIQEESVKLDEVKSIEAQIGGFNEELDAITSRLLNYLNEKIEKTEHVKETIRAHPFTDADDQLGIIIEHKCKAGHIQSILKDRIRYQSNPAVRDFIHDQNFGDDDIENYLERLRIVLDQARENTIEMKGENKISSVILEILSNSIYLNYDIKLGADSFNVMSPGKRALALLRVLVELDRSQHPIILDQPEDDLDNRSVYEGLAQYLEKKKNDRQIIVVTHNPNVVVGADSEQIIVANQSGQESNQDNRNFDFEYVYGGLECSFAEEGNPYVLEKQGIREHVCEILDGGEIAFNRREKLYSGFKKTVKLAEPEDRPGPRMSRLPIGNIEG